MQSTLVFFYENKSGKKKGLKHERMKTLQVSILIHRAQILMATKCLPEHFQIALLRALHNHYWILPGTGLSQRRAEPLLFLHYLDYLFTCAAISTMHGSCNTLRSSLKQWIQLHFMHRGQGKKKNRFWPFLFLFFLREEEGNQNTLGGQGRRQKKFLF